MSLSLAYIDDEPDLRELVAMTFDLDGRISLACFASGKEAVEAFENGGLTVDAILLDVMMPGMDGVETAARLAELDATRNVPVIFFTAHVREEEHERLRKAGAAGILAKPFDVMTLADQVMAILDQGSE
ncbi:response regulator [Hyphobacterium sp. HN65]|uniref:Response regulator n=1 Tax=Hyphobacterium lacteum TaxID=3116575 RepID=A0ABU7LSD8_9PROT|nr:response regulator [Hyphobacterium sp. HN65]MEE2526807.1 response regulator [Hyphobacterium sp. HN65]